MVDLAEVAVKQGHQVAAIMGARSADHLLDAEEWPREVGAQVSPKPAAVVLRQALERKRAARPHHRQRRKVRDSCRRCALARSPTCVPRLSRRVCMNQT